MELNSLTDLLLTQLQDVCSIEQQLVDVFPDIINALFDTQLQTALEGHFEETQGQLERIKALCQNLSIDTTTHQCPGMEGIIAEAQYFIEADMPPELADAALLMTIQKIEQYEIVTYTATIAYAKLLGNTLVSDQLQQTLLEEETARDTLDGLVENINTTAYEIANEEKESLGDEIDEEEEENFDIETDD